MRLLRSGWSLVTLLAVLISAVQCTLEPAQLRKLQDENGVIQLSDTTFKKILFGKRDYFLSVLFTTTNPDIPCETCKKFDPIYSQVVKSYFISNPTKETIFFINAEYKNNQESFQKLKLNQVPKLWIFPPSDDERYNVTSPHYTYPISESALNDRLDFAGFVSNLVQLNIVVQQDFEYTQFVKYFVVTFLIVLTLKKKLLSKIPFQESLALLSVFAILLFTGGYMFTLIRGIPFIAKNEKDEIMYYSGGTHWQFGSETFIVGALYFCLGLCFVTLVKVAPTIKDTNRRSILTIISSFAIFYLFNLLTKLYGWKSGGYPYSLTNYF